MLSDEVTAAIAKFFDGGLGPSHDELDRLIARAGLSAADPRKDDPFAGKMKRVRAVLWYASESDAEAGTRLVRALISGLRAAGSFRPTENNYPGAPTVDALRSALDPLGYELTPDGTLRSKSMEGLEGAKLTEALWAYVRRARTAADDSALRLGTAKDLAEATARHVLTERVGSYPSHGNFPTTLWQAYEVLGFDTPTPEAMKMLHGDAWSNIEQAARTAVAQLLSANRERSSARQALARKWVKEDKRGLMFGRRAPSSPRSLPSLRTIRNKDDLVSLPRRQTHREVLHPCSQVGEIQYGDIGRHGRDRDRLDEDQDWPDVDPPRADSRQSPFDVACLRGSDGKVVRHHARNLDGPFGDPDVAAQILGVQREDTADAYHEMIDVRSGRASGQVMKDPPLADAQPSEFSRHLLLTRIARHPRGSLPLQFCSPLGGTSAWSSPPHVPRLRSWRWGSRWWPLLAGSISWPR